MAVIVPSILEDNLEAFEDRLSTILKIPNVARIQIDFSDGIFTPRRTLEISDLDTLNPAYTWEAHVMVQNPGNYFLDAKIAGFQTVLFHYEAVKDKTQLEKLAAEIRALKMSPGLAVSTETSIREIVPFAASFDQVLVFSGHLGYHSHEFHEETFARVKELKAARPETVIEIDGSVNAGNIKKLSECGAELFVVGSALYEADHGADALPADIAAANFEKLRLLVQQRD